MPGNQSDSIDDLLGKKREGEPAAPVESASVEATPEVPVSPPEVAAPESSPQTLAEQITGREKEVSEEGEASGASPTGAVAVSRQSQAAATPAAGIANLSTIKSLPPEEQVKILTEIVMTKGLDKALATIKRLQNPYLYDLLHDTLVDELYQRLKGPKLK